VELDHGGAGSYGLRAVDLDLVVALGVSQRSGEGNGDEGIEERPHYGTFGVDWDLVLQLSS
jgi:hypothetical protein